MSGYGRNPDVPEPGFFLRSLVRGGWKVPCRIIRYDDGTWQAEVDGQLQGPVSADPHLAGGVMALWHYASDSDEAEYRYRTALREWATRNDPEHPCLRTRGAVNLKGRPPIF